MSKVYKLIQVFIIILVLNSFAFSLTPKWYSNLRQIELFKTTQQKVEKLFNYPQIISTYSGETGKTVEYKIKAGELTVTYSLGKCSGKSEYGYDVEKDVVTDFDIVLQRHIDISKLNLDLREFAGTEISDLPGVFTYYNAELGEYHEISKFKGNSVKVRSLEFFPNKSQESLACENFHTEK